MKIAVITEDGKTVSQHFGRAPYYLVVTVEDDEITDCELRDKLGHTQFREERHPSQEDTSGRHGYGAVAEQRHAGMAQTIADCQVLLCRGMGMGAYEGMQARGILSVVTDIVSIDRAVNAFLEGKIVDHVERLH